MTTKKTARQRFGVNLKTARKAAGFTQDALAREVGMTLNTIVRWERGEREPDTLAMMEVVAAAVGMTITELLE